MTNTRCCPLIVTTSYTTEKKQTLFQFDLQSEMNCSNEIQIAPQQQYWNYVHVIPHLTRMFPLDSERTHYLLADQTQM